MNGLTNSLKFKAFVANESVYVFKELKLFNKRSEKPHNNTQIRDAIESFSPMERLYTEIEILNQPNIHILTAFIYVKRIHHFKKKRQRQEEKSGKHAILRII